MPEFLHDQIILSCFKRVYVSIRGEKIKEKLSQFKLKKNIGKCYMKSDSRCITSER